MRRDFDDAVLFQHGIVGEHAVDRAAERARLHILARLTARPALEEAARDLVADLYTGDARADLDHLAGAIGQRHDLVAHRHAIGAAHDAEIAEIERAGSDLDQHLTVLRFRLRQIDASERFDSPAALLQLIGAHALSSRDFFDEANGTEAYCTGVTFTDTPMRWPPEPRTTPS